jgi:hypothetical protein
MSTFSEWKTRCFSTSGADYPRVGGFHKCSYPYGNGWCFSWKKSSGNPLVQWMRNMGVPLDVAETVMAGLPHALDPTSLLRCSSRAQTCAPRFLPPNDLQMLSETHIELVVYRRYIYINNVGLRFGLFIRYDKHEKTIVLFMDGLGTRNCEPHMFQYSSASQNQSVFCNIVFHNSQIGQNSSKLATIYVTHHIIRISRGGREANK